MSGWIKVEKDLANDPRVLKMASRLSHADVTLGSRSRLVVIGALVTLWWYADTHISDDDILPLGADDVDELVGLKGFCALMPKDWLQILDTDHVKLIDYISHNGSLAKNKALAQKRQQRHRKELTSTSRSRHAPVTQGALPDKTRQDIDKDKTPEREISPAVPRGTVIEMGANLTRTPEEILGEMEGEWREVEGINPTAMERWLGYLGSLSPPKRLAAHARLALAKEMAGYGNAEAQLQSVEFCIARQWRNPRRIQPELNGSTRKPYKPAPTTAELEAREAARAGG